MLCADRRMACFIQSFSVLALCHLVFCLDDDDDDAIVDEWIEWKMMLYPSSIIIIHLPTQTQKLS